MEIVMPRGDIHPVVFDVKDAEGYPITFIPDEIYFTVKNYATDRDAIFQKRLSRGEIEPGEKNGQFYFLILPEDTNGLRFGRYACDLEVDAPGLNIKTTLMGELVLTKEVTHSVNERGG